MYVLIGALNYGCIHPGASIFQAVQPSSGISSSSVTSAIKFPTDKFGSSYLFDGAASELSTGI